MTVFVTCMYLGYKIVCRKWKLNFHIVIVLVKLWFKIVLRAKYYTVMERS